MTPPTAMAAAPAIAADAAAPPLSGQRCAAGDGADGRRGGRLGGVDGAIPQQSVPATD